MLILSSCSLSQRTPSATARITIDSTAFQSFRQSSMTSGKGSVALGQVVSGMSQSYAYYLINVEGEGIQRLIVPDQNPSASSSASADCMNLSETSSAIIPFNSANPSADLDVPIGQNRIVKVYELKFTLSDPAVAPKPGERFADFFRRKRAYDQQNGTGNDTAFYFLGQSYIQNLIGDQSIEVVLNSETSVTCASSSTGNNTPTETPTPTITPTATPSLSAIDTLKGGNEFWRSPTYFLKDGITIGNSDNESYWDSLSLSSADPNFLDESEIRQSDARFLIPQHSELSHEARFIVSPTTHAAQSQYSLIPSHDFTSRANGALSSLHSPTSITVNVIDGTPVIYPIRTVLPPLPGYLNLFSMTVRARPESDIMIQPVDPHAIFTEDSFLSGDDGAIEAVRAPNEAGPLVTTFQVRGNANPEPGNASSIAVDLNGTVFVSDPGAHGIRQLGVDSLYAGSQSGCQGGSLTGARMTSPEGLAFAPGGILYVTDPGCHQILRIDPKDSGHEVSSVPLTPSPQNFLPLGIVADERGDLYVSDMQQNRVLKINMSSNANNPTWSVFATLEHPTRMTRDAAGNLWVVTSQNSTQYPQIQKIDQAGHVASFWQSTDPSDAVSGIAFDPYHNSITVAMSHKGVSALSQMTGIDLQPLAGGIPTQNDGFGATAGFSQIHGILYDAAGNLFIIDENSTSTYWTLRKINTPCPFGNEPARRIAGGTSCQVYFTITGEINANETLNLETKVATINAYGNGPFRRFQSQFGTAPRVRPATSTANHNLFYDPRRNEPLRIRLETLQALDLKNEMVDVRDLTVDVISSNVETVKGPYSNTVTVPTTAGGIQFTFPRSLESFAVLGASILVKVTPADGTSIQFMRQKIGLIPFDETKLSRKLDLTFDSFQANYSTPTASPFQIHCGGQRAEWKTLTITKVNPISYIDDHEGVIEASGTINLIFSEGSLNFSATTPLNSNSNLTLKCPTGINQPEPVIITGDYQMDGLDGPLSIVVPNFISSWTGTISY